MSASPQIPKYFDFFKPTLVALDSLGGSASIEELEEALVQALGLTQAQLDVRCPKSGAPVVPDRMSWARSWLKIGGYVENPKRGVWILTEDGRSAAPRTNAEIKKSVTSAYQDALAQKAAGQASEEVTDDISSSDEGGWNDQLLQKMQVLEPAAFERMCQRLLRESGFIKVEVSGKTGDGGIDGVGVLRVNLISFQVLFQCKRWQGSVGAPVVRDFRGAMQGRADKGLIITTGTFTTDARKEATRDGAPAIDLIDGEALCGLMKDLRLGVTVREVRTEEVTLDEGFFATV